MDHPLRLDAVSSIRPWRIAVAALAGVAAVELVLLVMAGGALLAQPGGARAERTKPAPASTRARATKPASTAKARATTTSATIVLPRRKVGLVVLNGSGRQGAAAATAARAQGRGYRIRGVANAPAADYPRTFVMFRPGFAPEARRLARDLGVRVVMPLDGMRPTQLQGAHAVLILGG
ncbi:MAG: LytR C-terminal domain-containing protein [Gaiella sp.]